MEKRAHASLRPQGLCPWLPYWHIGCRKTIVVKESKAFAIVKVVTNGFKIGHVALLNPLNNKLRIAKALGSLNIWGAKAFVHECKKSSNPSIHVH